jgi:hypothetical protein
VSQGFLTHQRSLDLTWIHTARKVLIVEKMFQEGNEILHDSFSFDEPATSCLSCRKVALNENDRHHERVGGCQEWTGGNNVTAEVHNCITNKRDVIAVNTIGDTDGATQSEPCLVPISKNFKAAMSEAMSETMC